MPKKGEDHAEQMERKKPIPLGYGRRERPALRTDRLDVIVWVAIGFLFALFIASLALSGW